FHPDRRRHLFRRYLRAPSAGVGCRQGVAGAFESRGAGAAGRLERAHGRAGRGVEPPLRRGRHADQADALRFGMADCLRRRASVAGSAVRDDAQPWRAHPRSLPVFLHHRAQRCRCRADRQGFPRIGRGIAGVRIPAAARAQHCGAGHLAAASGRRAAGQGSARPAGMVRAGRRPAGQGQEGRGMTSEVRNLETPVDYDPFADATLARVVPALQAQREVWLAAKLAPEASLAYNEAVTLELRGALDASALHSALRAVVAHHDALRTTFSADGTELCIAEQAEPQWNTRDLSALPQAERDAAVSKILREVVEIPFDLERGPLLKAELLKLGEREHLLVLSAHHLVCDGWSWGVIVHDLGDAYRAAHAHATPALPPAESLADYALAELAYADSDDHREAERYWLSRFASLPPPLALPT